MNHTLFMVRLHDNLRVRFDNEVRVERTKPHAIFSTRNEAEQYRRSHTPIDCNPFVQNVGAIYVDIENQKIAIQAEEGSLMRWQHDWQDVVDAIRDAGAKRPDTILPEDWEPWWDTLTSTQQAYLRDSLELPEWSENPFAMAETYIYDNFYLSYAVPLRMLNSLVSEWGLVLPAFTQWEARTNVGLLVSWWEDNAPKMTDEQKTALWRLMDPQPFEIVEVPIDRKT